MKNGINENYKVAHNNDAHNLIKWGVIIKCYRGCKISNSAI